MRGIAKRVNLSRLALLPLVPVLMIPLSAEAHAPGVSLSGIGTATIDGIIGPGEWDGAASLSFEANIPEGGMTWATLLVMNDDNNLYLAVTVARPTLDSFSHVRFLFDNDHDGVMDEGDDFIAVGRNEPGVSIFTDAFVSFTMPPGLTFADTAFGGTTDGAGAAFNIGGVTALEISHPLCSADSLHDFCLDKGHTVGFILWLNLNDGSGLVETRVPLGFQPYGDIVIPSPTPTPVPGVSGPGLVILAGLLLAASYWAYRRRRRQATHAEHGGP